MQDKEITLYIIKIAVNSVAALCAVLLWARTRRASWTCILSGIVINYAGIVCSLLSEMGILSYEKFLVLGIPFSELLFAVLPPLFFTAGIIIMLVKTKE